MVETFISLSFLLSLSFLHPVAFLLLRSTVSPQTLSVSIACDPSEVNHDPVAAEQL